MEYQENNNSESNTNSPKWRLELVDVNKFIVLFVMSLGLYSMWWMYKSWKFFQLRETPNIMPAARAIFAIFFAYPLFERIRTFAARNGDANSYNSSLLFIGFVLTNLTAQIPGPIGLVSIFAFIFLIPPVRAFNFAIMNSDEYEGEEVAQYSPRQMVVVGFGILFWGLVILGTLVGEPV